MNDHPYRNLPDHRLWRKAISGVPASEVDPFVSAPYRIGTSDRIVTAGSCFAQHVARYLRNAGLNFLVTETAHPITPPELAEQYGYGLFSARYGNIYTARQLLQLFQRVYGQFISKEDYWQEADGRYTDPFRPRIQEDRFQTLEEYRADREHHFACVRRAFEELDIFVFTLGLTECWISCEDGAAYPICPGTGGGEFDARKYKFVNFDVGEVTQDLKQFISLLRSVNQRARIILTVSPVPLVATAEDKHVLVATTYSKSVQEGNSSLFQTRPGSYSSAGLLRANKADDLLRARLRTVYVEAPPVFIGCCGVLTPCHTRPICYRRYRHQSGMLL